MMEEKKVAAATNNELSFSLLEVIGSIWRWKKGLIIFVVSAMVLTAVVSLMIPNYYKAQVTIMPANEEKDLFGSQTKNNSLYGDEDAVDRSIIFANSSPLVAFMIDSFKLAERYDIDVSTPKGEYKVAKRFRKLYQVKKNEFSGIELSLEDQSAEKAAEMLRAVLARLEHIHKLATGPSKQQLLGTYEQALTDKREELRRISDSLYILRARYKIYDVKEQGELLANTLVRTAAKMAEGQAKLAAFKAAGRRDSVAVISAQIAGYREQLKQLNEESDSARSAINLKAYNAGRERILAYENEIENLTDDIGEIRSEYAKFKAQAASQASSIIVLEEVEVPKIKSYPRRSLFVLGAGVLALILGVMAVLVLELNRKIDWKEVLDA
ncbi:Wzz/FepE/Etk N-terminal domain-containing protein [Saprospira sp. CCB-QB6]|uniref:Wzz/FepE/Etk N-terminal domain-containing protein n=1 Tax=Saprospira sp. CCB-QB6 TaxID=3023936 RepID=UPI00234B23F0|nr:Wzz/FepE/Etk N-terminal domain-containing protein [Saprospira sp. CCB-QB6]WCL81266.1 Wzz/FepE/Etk N-terminal domain-containing protein [Saprospira sp. CCB-QB6]